MHRKSRRSRIRMLLGQWGGWMVLLERLERELSAARQWIARAEDAALLQTARALETQILEEIETLLRMRGSISCLLQKLSASQQQVILLRYEKKLSWMQIALRLNFDERTVRRLEERAADALAASVLAQELPPR